MRSREPEDWIIISAVIIGGAGVLLQGVGSTSFLPVLLVGQSIITAVAAYYGLGVRRTLGVRLYRHQALGVSLMAVALLVSNFLFALFPTFANTPYISSISELAGAVFFFLLVTIFYWVDSSVRAAILSDPLVRDTLHWRQVRLVIWPVIVASLILIALINLLAPNLFQTDPFLGWLFPILFLAIFLSGAVFVPTYARRAGDKTLRTSLKWFGLFLASILVFVVVAGNLVAALQGVGLLAASYCLYRSARSLVPIYRFSDETS